MVLVNERAWEEKARMLRGWGRSSEKKGSDDLKKRFGYKLDGTRHDTKFVFDELGYNFLPSELGAAFGLEQLKKLQRFRKARQKNFKILKAYFQQYAEVFTVPEELPHVDTAWIAFPLTIRRGAPFSRYELVLYLEKNGVQTRPVFAGNLLRHKGFKHIPCKLRKEGYPVADYIMNNSFLIGCHQDMDDAQLDYMKELFENFLKRKGIRSS